VLQVLDGQEVGEQELADATDFLKPAPPPPTTCDQLMPPSKLVSLTIKGACQLGMPQGPSPCILHGHISNGLGLQAATMIDRSQLFRR
jgi:hypothetical protein